MPFTPLNEHFGVWNYLKGIETILILIEAILRNHYKSSMRGLFTAITNDILSDTINFCVPLAGRGYPLQIPPTKMWLRVFSTPTLLTQN